MLRRVVAAVTFTPLVKFMATSLNKLGRKAQEKILAIPKRLEKVTEYVESKSTAKSFRFDVVFGRVLEMA